ncbi:AAA family ATPase [Algibacter mikhailovii]|uniref:AAA family ATPase n=1 Tax=Algibacter mikhailovii TaxID=425498 RepID=UPI0024956D29|nr:hypothetical protein [Algibacter mikhailovii]
MRLTAIFIEDEDYEEGGYTINLGGNYFYTIKLGSGFCDVNATENKLFINDFFDKSGTLKNISAIVGGNGSGKTTLIYKIINLLNDNFTTGLTIWEDNEGSYFNKYRWTLPVRPNGVSLSNIIKELGTIYFSPYLDHKSLARGIDISADRYLAEDLNNIDSTFDANSRVVISERLKRGDYKRFINFQKSKFSEGVKTAYGLLDEDLYRVVFTRHKIDATKDGIDFEETPEDFRDYLNKLFLEIRKEYDELNKHVASDEERYELNKSQYKNFILMDVFCLLIKLMERKNMYLQEGHFRNKEEAKIVIQNGLDSYSKLKYWLNNYYYSKGVENPLPNDEVIKIVDFLFGYIDSLRFSKEGNYLNWSSKSLFFDEEDLEELLDLNEKLLIALPKYFIEIEKGSQNIYDSISDLQYFANPEYANRSLSSGETAMLHLYSRLYDFFSRHILNVQTIRKEDYYILFLDEADLAYHPSWKKSYIKTIIDFSVSFFSELDANVQIVFTTHDPLSLSDIPNSNVTYLHKESETRILSFNSVNRPTASFAANVNDLLGHSFFLEDLLIGDFARQKIDEVIEWINKNKDVGLDYNRGEIINIKKIIAQIEEPVLRNKLTEMISEIEVDEVFINDMINKQTKYLQDILKRSK